ncbi:hypothetical protein C4F40_01230 [Sphingobacterium sp. Ka21]|uniref:Uncharacterized protein n=1 Tax=Sphingobacterium pedocola TaxID=2082722 RepID=A0ABR9T1Y5_9SPHI|nr:hypothetical protein [Sphingobacterium pedocola]
MDYGIAQQFLNSSVAFRPRGTDIKRADLRPINKPCWIIAIWRWIGRIFGCTKIYRAWILIIL